MSGAADPGAGRAGLLRVLVVTVAHTPEDARVRHREIGALLGRGHTVTFVAPFTSFGVAPMEGLSCVDVPRSVGRHRVGPVVAATRQLWKRLPEHDVVIVHDPELVPSLVGVGVLGRGRRPVLVWDVHEDVPAQVEMVPWLWEPAKRPFAAMLHAVERLAERRLRLLLAEHLYQGRFSRTHPVVPNSTVVPSAAQVAVAAAANPGHRVVYVGAITAARGLEEMVAVAAALPDDITLELIGNATPAIDARLRALPASSGIDYRGFVPNRLALARIPGALAGLLLLADKANYRHSQPTKLIEYLAHGVPAISTPHPLPTALLDDTGAGVVIPFGPPAVVVEAVVEAVLALRDDPARRAAMGERGRATAEADFSWDNDGRAFVDKLEAWVAERAAERADAR